MKMKEEQKGAGKWKKEGERGAWKHKGEEKEDRRIRGEKRKKKNNKMGQET